ncbi:MAG: hypothetical protein K8S25_00505 [Alphaproteobacteria bacterium]|nr:hypothetical protein [Alphaproteobacteria bacterium]
MRPFVLVAGCLLLGLTLSGCAAIAIVDTAVSVTTTVVGTTVDVAAGAVRTVAGSSDDKKLDCEDADKDTDACKKKQAKPD